MTFPVEPRLLVVLAGVVLVGLAVWAIGRLLAARRWGAPVAFDEGRRTYPDLVSEEHRLVGRPDELWRHPDGRLIPVEIKSRRAPSSGVFASHRVQVEAYCLLLESTTGRPPPYGVVSYAGGESRKVPWNREARDEVLRLLRQVRLPYDGRADPSQRKCSGCRYRTGCDARAN